MYKKKIIAITAIAMWLSISVFSSESASSAYNEGCKFYSEGDWSSAEIMLKKAVSYPENFNPDVYYMLITAEVYAGDFKGALDDCNAYMGNFPDSSFYPRVKYFKGKILHELGEYEKAIIELSDFCHQYVDDELYSYALYYIGESLFACYKYDEARGIFDRIVVEFPYSEKAPAAQYRIDTILQHSREEKLLYLLKQTGEEYLSAKEDYEKQLKMYNSDTVNTTRQKLSDAQSKNNAFEKQIADLQSQLETLKADAKKLEAERDAANAGLEEAEAAIDAAEAARNAAEMAKVEAEAARSVAESEKEDAEAAKNAAEEERDAAIEKSNNAEPVIQYITVHEEEPVIHIGEDSPAKKETVPAKEDKKPVHSKTFSDDTEKSGQDVPSLEPYDETKEQIRILKEKAREVQRILDSRDGK